jgi:hypothetical protein
MWCVRQTEDEAQETANSWGEDGLEVEVVPLYAGQAVQR